MADLTKRQQRIIPVTGIRATDEGTKIVGLCTTYNSPYEYGSLSWGWMETFAPRSVKPDPDAVSALNHNYLDCLLGRMTNQTLSFQQLENGLELTVTPNRETRVGADSLAYVGRGDITGMSIAFDIKEWEYKETDDGQWDQLLIKDAILYEAGPVVFPANPNTNAGLRNAVTRDNAMTMRESFKSEQLRRSIGAWLDSLEIPNGE